MNTPLRLFLFALVAAFSGAPFGGPIPLIWGPLSPEWGQFSSENRILLVGFGQVAKGGLSNYRQTAYLIDGGTGKTLARVPDWVMSPDTLRLSPDGRRVLAVRRVDDPKRIRAEQLVLWDWKGPEDQAAGFEPTTDHIEKVAFSPDGALAFTGHRDGRILVWDVATKRSLRAFEVPPLDYYPHSPEHIPSFWFPKGGGRVVATDSTTTRVWDIATGRTVWDADARRLILRAPGTPSQDGRWVCTVDRIEPGYDIKLRLRDAIDGRSLWAVTMARDSYSYVPGLTFSADGRTLLVVDDRGWLYAWDVMIGKQLWKLALFRKPSPLSVRCSAFSADGRLLLTVGDRTTLRLWDVEKRKPVWSADVPSRAE